MSRSPATSLFRSTDGGVSWAPADSGLPARAEVTSLVLDAADSRTLYASTDRGVFWTHDAGASWQSLTQSMNGLPVGSLTLDPVAAGARARVLRAGNPRDLRARDRGGRPRRRRGRRASRVLSWDADSLTVRTLEDAGGESRTPPEGPSFRWLASAIADGPDGLSRVLWLAGDGRAALEVAGPAGREAVLSFPAVANWAPADVSMGADGKAHLLWTSVSGAMYLTSVDGAANVRLGPSYGPFAGWTALAIADAPDGSTRVLWRANDGRFSISVHHGLAMGEVVRFAAIPGRAAADITVASDGNARVLLLGGDGTAEVATVDALGSLANARTHANADSGRAALRPGPTASRGFSGAMPPAAPGCRCSTRPIRAVPTRLVSVRTRKEVAHVHPERSSQVRDRFTRRRPRGAGYPPRRRQRMDRQPAGRRDPLVGGAVRLVGGRSGRRLLGAGEPSPQERRRRPNVDVDPSFVEISSVHVSPASASTVYLGAARSGSAAGIFKSTDGGATEPDPVANGGVSVDRID